MATTPIDILFWAAINPDKFGSFEGFICNLAMICREQNLRIKFVLCDRVDESILDIFIRHRVDMDFFSENDIYNYKTAIKVFSTYHPRITHFNFIPTVSLLTVFIKFIVGCSIFHTDHSSDIVYQDGRWIFRKIKEIRRKMITRSVDHFIGVSEFVARRIISGGIDSRKVTAIYNGIDTDRFKPSLNKYEFRRRLGISDNSSKIISFIGQLIPEKGLNVFLDIATFLCAERSDVVFLISGGGKLKDWLTKEIRNRGLDSRVRFLGLRNDVDSILGVSDIFVCPSEWNEAFGLVIAEAMACGVPIVASRVGGIPEVIEDEGCGILVSPGDIKGFIRAINRLLENETLRETFSLAARDRSVKLFNIKKMTENYIHLYKQYME